MCHIFVRRSFTSKQHGEMIQFDGPHIFFRWGGLKPPTRYTSNPPFPNHSTETHEVDVITRGLCVCHAASVNVEYVNVSGIDWVGGSSENVGWIFPENWTNVPKKRDHFKKICHFSNHWFSANMFSGVLLRFTSSPDTKVHFPLNTKALHFLQTLRWGGPNYIP